MSTLEKMNRITLNFLKFWMKCAHYTTAVAEDGKSWFSDGFFLGKGMILCSEKHVPPSVNNYVRLSR